MTNRPMALLLLISDLASFSSASLLYCLAISMALRVIFTKKLLRSGFHPQPTSQIVLSRGLQTFSLPDLPYDYGALEPAISGEIMQLHHQKHHQAYVTNYNKALEQLHEAISKGDSATVAKLQSAIKFNGGVRAENTVILYDNMVVEATRYTQKGKEGGGEPPKGSLGWAIDTDFGSLDALVKKISTEGAALQGSGWVWLALDKELKKLVVETTPNQDPLVTKGASLVPLLGIDVWEHAYYLQYKNVRPDYLKNIWKVCEKEKESGERLERGEQGSRGCRGATSEQGDARARGAVDVQGATGAVVHGELRVLGACPLVAPHVGGLSCVGRSRAGWTHI
ncbi:hypothetical protein G4B88_010170 [Cannabis sativa]|uniref:superoxide dismutase n=1 Tax=Cannabis sativa TaxID=3483 RepID=A0A7J6E4J8_CANSA|nr:hypothetical protein G4B88_010170 [Cannabis sativa]